MMIGECTVVCKVSGHTVEILLAHFLTSVCMYRRKYTSCIQLRMKGGKYNSQGVLESFLTKQWAIVYPTTFVPTYLMQCIG